MSFRGRPAFFFTLLGDSSWDSDDAAAAAVVEGLLCRSDFLVGGDFSDVVDTFFATVCVDRDLEAVDPDAAREPFCLLALLACPFVCDGFAA